MAGGITAGTEAGNGVLTGGVSMAKEEEHAGFLTTPKNSIAIIYAQFNVTKAIHVVYIYIERLKMIRMLDANIERNENDEERKKFEADVV
ncbi:hypothetical protein OUZ56_007205 [Daphnia magna]|uniref:Uncharacterized protein n=1 Tax=Daphnia magna TaxID=35525 RepID=A0ABQ9YXX1_9CRUS|nr:hypothetical protein OUZ56_007205 [Daphnia magna]